MIDHLKQLSADTEEVILAACALARRSAGSAEAAAGGSVELSGVPDTRELANELAVAKEQLRGHESRVAEWERKVASAEEAQKVAAESFKKGQKDVQAFKQQCAKLEVDIKAEKALREEAEKKVCYPFLVWKRGWVDRVVQTSHGISPWCPRQMAVVFARLQTRCGRSSRAHAQI